MKRSLALPTAALSLTSIVAAASNKAAFKSYVDGLNRKVADAFVAKDSKFFDTLLAPDFKSRDEHGVVHGRKESLFALRFQLNTVRVLSYKVTVKSVSLQKTQGTVVCNVKMLGLTPSRRGRPGEKVEIVRRLSDVYEKRGRAWALIYQSELAAPAIKTVAAVPLRPAGRTQPKRKSGAR